MGRVNYYIVKYATYVSLSFNELYRTFCSRDTAFQGNLMSTIDTRIFYRDVFLFDSVLSKKNSDRLVIALDTC